MAKNPDPLLPITSYGGKTRTLDDWATVFNLAIVVLPDRPEGASFLGIVDRIFATFGDSAPDWSGLTAPVRGHFAASDDFFPPDAVRELERQLQDMGKDVALEIHAACGHAFLNEENPLGTYDAGLADNCWAATAAFLHDRLG